MDIRKTIDSLGLTVNRNSPTILMSLGITGLVGSVAMAVKATPTAMALVEDELYSRFQEAAKTDERLINMDKYLMSLNKDGYNPNHFLTILEPKDTFMAVYKAYLPVAAVVTISVAAIFLGNRIHLRRTAALASAYSILEGTLKTYQEKVIETVGKNKYGEIQGKVAKQTLDNNPPTDENTYNLGGGIELCYEMSTGRYFYSDAAKIHAVVNKFNHELMSDNVKMLNELYYDLGLPGVELGNYVGWEIDDGLVEETLIAQVSQRNERPTLVLDFINRPKYLLG